MRVRRRLVPALALLALAAAACTRGESVDAPTTTVAGSDGTAPADTTTPDPALMSLIEVTVTGDVEDTFTLNGECTLVADGEEGLAVDLTLDVASEDGSRQLFHSNPIDESGLTVIIDDAVYQTPSSQSEISGTSATVTANGASLEDPSRQVSITAAATGCTR